jgi:ATP-dependent protease ClpP protease subunit
MAKKIIIRGFIGISENATPQFLEKELLSANGGEIDLEFSSGGGFVFPGLEMANMVKNYSGKIVAKITGLAASMSSYIPMMADEVIAEDNAVFMIHNVSGFSFGDFREAAKVAKHLESLRDVLAKAYVAKTGKSIAEVQGLMDDESFFYGDEIVDDGFADKMVEAKSGDDNDKDTAVALAQAEIKECAAQMKSSSINISEDFERAVAYHDEIGFESANSADQNKSPASAGKPPQEAIIMNLKELLAANPEAKAEHDALIINAKNEARAEGEAAGKETMKAAFTAAIPILSSDSYPESVKKRVSAKAEAGDVEGLADFVALHDMNTEQANGEEAGGEEGDETLPDANADSQSNFDSKKQRLSAMGA